MRKIISFIFISFFSVFVFSQTWDDLSELEKYAVAFSSNLFELNDENHFDFESKTLAAEAKKILKSSWNITDYKTLVENYYSLEEGGHSGAYAGLLEKLNKYENESILEIARKEHLGVLETTRLYYVSEMKKVLGSHGIEAWDEGREITILRWGMGAGYISYDEAIKLIEPVVERIKANYVSWEDFTAHYIAGRAFYGLFSSDYTRLVEDAVAAAQRVPAAFPCDKLKFNAKNADKKHKMNFKQSFYNPSKEAKKWEEVQNLFNREQGDEELIALEKLENDFPECRDITFGWHLELLHYLSAEDAKILSFIDSNKAYIDSLPENNSDYIAAKYEYMYSANNIGRPDLTLNVFEALPDSLKKNIYFYYQYACAYYIYSEITPSETEKSIYQSRAVNAFRQVEKQGMELNDFVKKWIESVE